MEARRRLAILTSHFRPRTPPTSSCISASNCDSPSDVEKGNNGSNCVFCKIIRGESPAFKLYEDDICICILDANPLSPGHSLIIPKCHFSCLEATPPSVVGAMCSKVPYISNAVMKATGCDSFNLLVNNGAAAGQVIYHTHVHIIPRNARDCLWASENGGSMWDVEDYYNNWIGETIIEISQSLRRHPMKLDKEVLDLVDCIREQLSFLDNFEK